jgi:hypothetical protein
MAIAAHRQLHISILIGSYSLQAEQYGPQHGRQPLLEFGGGRGYGEDRVTSASEHCWRSMAELRLIGRVRGESVSCASMELWNLRRHVTWTPSFYLT